MDDDDDLFDPFEAEELEEREFDATLEWAKSHQPELTCDRVREVVVNMFDEIFAGRLGIDAIGDGWNEFAQSLYALSDAPPEVSVYVDDFGQTLLFADREGFLLARSRWQDCEIRRDTVLHILSWEEYRLENLEDGDL